MKRYNTLMSLSISLAFTIAISSTLYCQLTTQDKEKKYESEYKSLSSKVDKERIRQEVYYLSKDPLPRRVMNWSLPGHTLSTLEEADAWIMKQLSTFGYDPVTDNTKVRAFGRDFSKPPSQQYARPADDAPV
jgi:hypothetical protein